ncbi:MAG: hypothetical protein HY782_24635 [Chloroflexi bacterium]|nr:hypothetical protein [Chloroflexota bacterium]
MIARQTRISRTRERLQHGRNPLSVALLLAFLTLACGTETLVTQIVSPDDKQSQVGLMAVFDLDKNVYQALENIQKGVVKGALSGLSKQGWKVQEIENGRVVTATLPLTPLDKLAPQGWTLNEQKMQTGRIVTATFDTNKLSTDGSNKDSLLKNLFLVVDEPITGTTHYTVVATIDMTPPKQEGKATPVSTNPYANYILGQLGATSDALKKDPKLQALDKAFKDAGPPKAIFGVDLPGPIAEATINGQPGGEIGGENNEQVRWRFSGDKPGVYKLQATGPKRLPLIFVPGIAGSVLQLDGVAINANLWPFAPLGSRTNLGLERDGMTPAIKGVKIIAPDIIRSAALGTTKIYSPLMQALKAQGYKEDTDLFILPYDWRLDNTQHVLRLAALVDEVLQKCKSTKVNILTHSMGGLIGRGYVNSAGKTKVDTLITMSMPFYGSPVAYYATVNGYSFGNATVRAELIKVLGQNWPAPYQLSPRKPFIIDAATNQALPLEESYRLRYKGFLGVEQNIILWDTYTPTPDNVWTFNPGLVQRANDFHALLVDRGTQQEKPLPTGVKHYAIIGHGVRSLSWYRMRDAQPGEAFLELGARKVVLEPQFLDGDGTVPLWGLDFKTATRKYYVTYLSQARSGEHTEVTQNPITHSIIKNILNRKPPEPNQYRPPEYVDLNTFLYFFEGIDFTLHSDAHLSIVDQATGFNLGFNDQGGIDEQILTGSFLSIDGVEYASLAHLPSSYQVQVKGTGPGKFTLNVDIKKNGSTTTFVYSEVPVKQGTLAQLVINPSQVTTAFPEMQVTTDGKTTVVRALLPRQITPSAPAVANPLPSPPSSPQGGAVPVASIATPVISQPETATRASDSGMLLALVLGGAAVLLVIGAMILALVFARGSRPQTGRPRMPRPTDLPERGTRAKSKPTDLPR